MHRDVVRSTPPEGVQLLGSTSLCTNQGMYAPHRFITVQGHPEFTGTIVTEIVNLRHEMGLFTDDMAQDALGRVEKEHDGVVIATAFLKFLLDDK